MNKQQVLNKINNSLYELSRALDKQYRGKVFAVSNETKIDCFYKTKRGAEGYIRRNEGFSYYDEQTMEMYYPYDTLEITEIKIDELTNYDNAELWEKELTEFLGWKQYEVEWFVNCYIDKVTDETLKVDILKSAKCIKEKGKFTKFAHKKEKEVLHVCHVFADIIVKTKEGKFEIIDNQSYLYSIENGKKQIKSNYIYDVGDYILNNCIEISICDKNENLSINSLNQKQFLSIIDFIKAKENGVMVISELRYLSDGILANLLIQLGHEGTLTYTMTEKLLYNLLEFCIQGEYTNYKNWIDVWLAYKEQHKIAG